MTTKKGTFKNELSTFNAKELFSFSTDYNLKCDYETCGGWRTEDCRNIGQSEARKFTYAGYHAQTTSGYSTEMYLPIIGSDSGDEWHGGCDDQTTQSWCPTTSS